MLRLVAMKISPPVTIRQHRLRLPQGSLFWHEAGQGEAIVLLHGTWHDSSQWYPLLQELASQYHCIAPDLLGFGESSQANGPYSIALEVESLEALLSRLRVQKVYLVAHSLGAWVAFNLAQHHPDRIKGIFVIEPEGFVPKTLQGRWRLDRWLIAAWSPLAWLLQTMTPLMQRLGQNRWLGQWRQRRQRLSQSSAACRLLFRRRRMEVMAELVSASSDDIAAPIMVVQSDPTSPTGHELTQACLQTFPQANHQILPWYADSLSIKPEALSHVLMTFLTAHGGNTTIHDHYGDKGSPGRIRVSG